jgi:hypothetical protein
MKTMSRKEQEAWLRPRLEIASQGQATFGAMMYRGEPATLLIQVVNDRFHLTILDLTLPQNDPGYFVVSKADTGHFRIRGEAGLLHVQILAESGRVVGHVRHAGSSVWEDSIDQEPRIDEPEAVERICDWLEGMERYGLDD